MTLTFNPCTFIEEVKKRPGLFDAETPVDRVEKLELWKQVGAALFPEWDSYSKATAYDRVLQLQKKWRSFRDAYSRELRLRRKQPRRTRKPYRYFKRMSFLGGYEGPLSPMVTLKFHRSLFRRFTDVIQNKDSVGDDEQKKLLYPVHELNLKEDEDVGILAEEEPVEVLPKKVKKRKRKRESSESIQATEEYEMPMPIFSSEISDGDCDSDKLFLLSFVPEMRQLPVNIKMWARAQIANVMQEAVNSHYNNTTPGSAINSFSFKTQRHDQSD